MLKNGEKLEIECGYYLKLCEWVDFMVEKESILKVASDEISYIKTRVKK